MQWSSQTALRADQTGSSGAFRSVPLFAGTLLIPGIPMVVTVPIGLMAALFCEVDPIVQTDFGRI